MSSEFDHQKTRGAAAAPRFASLTTDEQRAPVSLLAAAAAAALVTLGCAATVPPRPVPQAEDRQALPAWYPQAPWTAERGQRLYLEGKVVFDTARWHLRQPSEHVLAQLAAYLEQNPDISRLRLEGHTDSRAGDEYNQKLSERRAIAVADWLVDHGVDNMRLLAVAFGETRPMATNDTPPGRQENRRTEFHIAEIGGSRFMGKDPSAGGLVLEVLSKEERELAKQRGQVPVLPPEPPFVPELDVIKPVDLGQKLRAGSQAAPSDAAPDGKVETAGDD